MCARGGCEAHCGGRVQRVAAVCLWGTVPGMCCVIQLFGPVMRVWECACVHMGQGGSLVQACVGRGCVCTQTAGGGWHERPQERPPPGLVKAPGMWAHCLTLAVTVALGQMKVSQGPLRSPHERCSE